MQYKTNFIILFCVFNFYNYLSASQKQQIQAQLILGNEWLAPSKGESWDRFGIAAQSNDKIEVIEIKNAFVAANQQKNQNAIDWCHMPPLSIQESGESINVELLEAWGMDQKLIEAGGGGIIYRFPSDLPKNLFIDKDGKVKKEVTLNFTVGNDAYEVLLNVTNPEKIKTESLFGERKQDEQLQKPNNLFHKTYWGGLLALAMVALGILYTKSV